VSEPQFDIDALIGTPATALPAAAPPASVAPLPSAGGDKAMGAFEGADRYDQGFALWGPVMRSADADLLPDKQTIDLRTRDMLRNDAYIQGGANLHKDNIVGAQFLLNVRPATARLFGKEDDVWEEEFQAEAEELFELFAESPDNWVDAARTNNLTQLVRMAVGIHLAAGEVLSTAEWDVENASDFSTCIQMVDLDRLSTAPFANLDQSVRAGVRRNRRGAPISYQIRTQHPSDVGWLVGLPEWKEVPIRKPWGRLQVIHLKEQVRPEQTRGIPEMAAALKEMRMGHSLRDISLQHMVTQSLYAAAITSDMPTDTLFQQLGGGEMAPEQVEKVVTNFATGYMGAIAQYAGKSKGLTIDGVRIPHLYPGTKLDLISPGANTSLGTAFEQSILRYIAATLGVSYEQLSRDYTSTNYSSARAAMTETWKFMQARKKLIADRFATIIFRLWLEEAVNKNLLTTFPKKKAGLLYTNGRLNLAFDALSRCDWIGASRGQIDELKETQAAIARIESGLSTHEDELARLGKDFRKVFRQLKREKALREQLGISFTSKTAQAAGAQNDAGDEDKQDKQEKKAA